MPTYGYRCEQCDATFDVWQRMTDEAKADCPTCGRPATRQFFPAGIVFKGGGFYKTDSRSSDSAATPAPTTKTETKTDTPKSTPTDTSSSTTESSPPPAAPKKTTEG